MIESTYDELFAYLKSLGFADQSKTSLERVFTHRDTGAILLFAMIDDPATDRPVRPADMLSAEFHLQTRGLLSGNLSDALSGITRA